MTVSVSPAEALAQLPYGDTRLDNGIIHGDPYTYQGGTTAEALRSGRDGPHAVLADQICSLNGRFFA